ncbi:MULTISPECIES: tripartite tricarboxylate transporter TctB family protein [Dethiosulfovibrio]|uniref:Tripartite tricarboxylate transporter TctB family protein n=2 Tax=Dethiosulfovibrio TaxID=47054 RepID=A0ABS9EM96_9BACT|nr:MULTISPECIES: tripartite tricarboxylate transporter TctB family protein [Dethiosulfovibrio]MCF4113260.1 tripartite tricarboxylate transporter TctB family protein [Dethiosulfovibrio russensis]MCF4142324.1 tripartite tricarboxylate transporter TctB family protein [Dethiosulfovibrio marinus]MCF4144632.1 tripartite tricarboxylate transporter TctB family protein [Dethiosulfovibrio acidaminovorans]MEA3285700.1 tripartite tricarboxylate transporter TctB family protein [Synergistota bacterium]
MQEQSNSNERRPGEIGFAFLFILFGALGFYFALDMTSGKYSSPSVAPKIASSVIMLMGAIELWKGSRKQGKGVNAGNLFSFLFTREVLFVLVLLALYSFFLPILHFPLASFLFLFLSLLYLHHWKKIGLCSAISLGTVVVLVGVFKYVFQVMLP